MNFIFNKQNYYLLLFIILIFYSIQTTIFLDIRCHEDEAWQAAIAYNLLKTGKLSNPMFTGPEFSWYPYAHPSEGKYYVKPPCLEILLAFIFDNFGVSLVKGRLLMIFFSLMTIIVTFLISKKLISLKVAILSSLLLTVDNLFFVVSRTIRPESLVALLLCCAYLFFKKIKENEKFSFLIGIVCGLSILTHPNGLISFISILLLFVIQYGLSIYKQRPFYFFILACFFICLPYMLYIVSIDYPKFFLVKYQMFQKLNMNGNIDFFSWLGNQIKQEIFIRYKGFLLFPFRIHIALIIIAAFMVALQKIPLIRHLIIIVIVHIFLFIFMPQHKTQYLAILSPMISIIIATVSITMYNLYRKIVRFIIVLILILFTSSQLIGNFAYLMKFKDTRYYTYTSRMKKVIPKQASIYGTPTFWFAFYQQPYYSYIGTSYEYALNKIKPKIIIMDDRIMMDLIFFNELRKKLHVFLSKHGKLLGNFPNHFYGNIKVFLVNYKSTQNQ